MIGVALSDSFPVVCSLNKWVRFFCGGVCLSGALGAAEAARPEKAKEALPLEKQAEELPLLHSELLELKGRAPSGLPSLATPDAPALSLSPRPLSTDAELQKKQQEAWRKKNWLVEGVRQQTQEAASEDLGKEARREAWLKSTLGAEVWLQQGVARNQVSDIEAVDLEKRHPLPNQGEMRPAVADPFQSFMASWVSPRDYELLVKKPGATEKTDPLFEADLSRKVSGGGGPIPAENPYLKGIGEDFKGSVPISGEPKEGTLVGSGAFDKDKPLTPVVTPQTEAEKDAAKTPEFKTKVEEDRKYFPQLKRF